MGSSMIVVESIAFQSPTNHSSTANGAAPQSNLIPTFAVIWEGNRTTLAITLQKSYTDVIRDGWWWSKFTQLYCPKWMECNRKLSTYERAKTENYIRPATQQKSGWDYERTLPHCEWMKLEYGMAVLLDFKGPLLDYVIKHRYIICNRFDSWEREMIRLRRCYSHIPIRNTSKPFAITSFTIHGLLR